MTRGSEIPAGGRPDGDGVPVVDRYGEPIGTKRDSDPPGGDGEIGVALTDTLHHLLGLEEATVTLPACWVAGVRRDEIRLSMAVHDPAFSDGVTVIENGGPSLEAAPDAETPAPPDAGGPGPLRVPRARGHPKTPEEGAWEQRVP